MARKKPTDNTYVFFDVVYQDGSLNSNRRIASAELLGPDGDAPAKSIVEAQDREIAERSGRPRGPIKTIVRSPNQ